ncbi:cation:proton antiporter [Methylocystis echinoides]|uniref:Sodium/hydrogen exchanger n=1 Tax=Methylocystis echinoides TaxID=29468 RepID=A0A9W6LSK5_9HYPH|nr:cation:proton antiporter [Methylocystis echinoides]GLI93683.1 sodium/hydrogen exchanger [Methylocystis echinoides]
MTAEFQGLFLILSIAVLAPLANRLPALAHVPIVAIELVLGVIAGPSVLGLVVNDSTIDFLGRFGLVFLFFQAGFEFKMKDLGPGPLRLGFLAWLISLAASVVFVGALWALGLVKAPALVALVLPTTAFGVLLPILRQGGELNTDFGRHVMGAAAVGELCPLIFASIALAQEKHHLHQTVLSALFLLIAVASVFLLATLRSERLSAIILRWLGDSELLPVRVSLVMLLGFVSLAGVMGMEAVVGAYAAGMAVATLVDGTRAQALESRLKTIGAGFFVPIFFIASGVEFDVSALLSSPGGVPRLLLFCLAFAVIRMAPLALYRGVLGERDLPPFALLSATTLPLVVAISYLGARSGQMSAENASALVGAALVTVTLFPTLALSARSAARASRPPDSIETALGRCSDAIATRVNDLLAAAMRNLPARW